MGRQSQNQLKVKKQTRMRRAYRKGYDMGSLMKAKRSVGTTGIQKEHLDYFAYRRRGNSYWDEYLEAKWPSRGQISPNRQAALARLEEMTNEVVPEMNIVLYKGGITKTILRMYFSSDYSVVFFMYEDWHGGYMLKSGIYKSRERAMLAYESSKRNLLSGTINWFTRIDLPFIHE